MGEGGIGIVHSHLIIQAGQQKPIDCCVQISIKVSKKGKLLMCLSYHNTLHISLIPVMARQDRAISSEFVCFFIPV